MKNRFNLKTIIASILFLSIFTLSTSCSDWTDPEGLDIEGPTIENENNALYQQYLEELRS